jgi:hypothetical protein
MNWKGTHKYMKIFVQTVMTNIYILGAKLNAFMYYLI